MFQDIPRPGLWKRLLLGGFLVVFAAAAATAVAAFHEVDKVVSALELGTELKLGKNTLATTDPGKAQTILILGSDHRPKVNGEGASGARSDTIMLVRLNPDKEATAIMSLPRDLKVRIPGHGVDKINAAYEYGGPGLTLRTVKELTGLPVNHVVNVTFKGFWRAVNAIGCVYTDVDRDYFNDSAEFTYINIDPGYQRLCARQALQYVRFRHFDTDIVRSARQQDFLRQMKQQVTYTDLISKRDRLVKIFGRNTATDATLRSRSEVLRLVKLAVFSAGQPIQEIHFEGQIGESFVEASDAQVKKLVQRFLDVQESPGPRGEAPDERPARKPKRRQRRADSSIGRLRRHRDRRGPGPPGGKGRCGRLAAGVVPDAARELVPVLATPAGVQADGHGRQEVRRVPDGHEPHQRERGVLRAPGHHLEGPADPRQPDREAHGRRPTVRAALRRRPAPLGGVAHAEGLVLGLQHAASNADEEADDGHRPFHSPLLLTRLRRA